MSALHPSPSRHRRILRLAGQALACFLVIIPCQLTAQVHADFFLNNGSFEQGDFTPNLFQSAEGGEAYRSTAIPGWVALRAPMAPVWHENEHAQDGSRYVSLSSAETRTGSILHISANDLNNPLSLTRQEWDLGEWYELSFWAAGGEGERHVLWVEMPNTNLRTAISIPGTETLPELSPAGLNWERQSFLFRPHRQEVSLILSTHSTAFTPNNMEVYLDNFAITKVPEPGSAVLLLLGLSILSRRKRH